MERDLDPEQAIEHIENLNTVLQFNTYQWAEKTWPSFNLSVTRLEDFHRVDLFPVCFHPSRVSLNRKRPPVHATLAAGKEDEHSCDVGESHNRAVAEREIS